VDIEHAAVVLDAHCPAQDDGDFLDVIFATLTCPCPEFTRPANSSMVFGFVPAAATTAGAAMSFGIAGSIKPIS
jgi:hypothetical protein